MRLHAALLAVLASVIVPTTTMASPAVPDRVVAVAQRPLGRSAVLGGLRQIRQTVKSTSYTHHGRIDPAAGVYDFDCSSMISYVLERSAPKARRAVLERAEKSARATGKKFDRMRAVNYYEQFVATPTDGVQDGWQRVQKVKQISPGDVLVWLRPEAEAKTNHNTGHAMVAVGRPKRVPGLDGAYLLRVTDASSRGHGDDARTTNGTNGFGTGTILLFADRDGNPKAFGRLGKQSYEIMTSPMAIGRPVE